MKQVTEKNCIETLIREFPNFSPYWKVYCEEEGESSGLIFDVMMCFGDYIIDLIKINNIDELKNVFNFVEYLICHGDESVQTAMTTGLLEGLLNISPKKIKFKVICPYLGKESKEYCRAWDEFCGLKTDGLWD